MSQFEYDVTEFVLNNKEELQRLLKEESCKHEIFKDYSHIYEESLKDHYKSKLISILSDHFNVPIDTLHLIITEDFVNIILY